MDLPAMASFYDNPDFQAGFHELFATPPAAGIWSHPAGQWVEW
jgi:predicted NAD/FAD-binding protein